MFITDELIEQHVRGKSFCDVGPLWETVNEKVSIADHFGASSLCAIDQFPLMHPLWNAFHARMVAGGVKPYLHYACNVLDYGGTPFDVVYCGGVIYHSPDPIHLLKKLHSMTKERLILTSTVITGSLKNEEGELNIPEGGLVFVPALTVEHKKVVALQWQGFLGGRPSGGLVDDKTWDASSYYDWWWLFTPRVLDTMANACGFAVERTHLEREHYYVMSLRA